MLLTTVLIVVLTSLRSMFHNELLCPVMHLLLGVPCLALPLVCCKTETLIALSRTTARMTTIWERGTATPRNSSRATRGPRAYR